MKSMMTLSEDSGILIFSESYSNDEKVSDSLSDIQLSSSLFALYKLSSTNRALRWLRKDDSLLLFRTTNSTPAPPDNTTHSVGGLLVIVVFDAAFNDDEAANIADLVTNLLREQILPPIENLRQSQKRLLSAALLSLYRRILGDLFLKLITAETGEMLGAVSSSTSASMHIVMYRKFSPLSPSDADYKPMRDRVNEKVMKRDDAGAINESVRQPEGSSYTGALPPVSLPLPDPMPVPMNSSAEEQKKNPLWRRFFQHVCCAPTPTARPTAESLSVAKGVSVSACTPPSATLDPTLSADTHDHITHNSYGGKYLLLRPGDGMVTREDASVVTRAGAAHRQLILSSEMKIGKMLESRSICNGRSVFSLSPEAMKVRLGKRPVYPDSHPKGEHEASLWVEAEMSQDAAFLQGLEVADADGCEMECLFKILVVAYQDLRVLVCTPSTAASDTVATHSMNSDRSTEIAGTGTEVETRVGFASGIGAGRVLCSPVIRTLSPASLAAWKHFYIFSSICLGGVLSDSNSAQSMRSKSLQWSMEQNEQQVRM